MAKKRKKDKGEKEEYEFRPPEFNEKEFLRKEIKDTKTAMMTIIYAVAFGGAAGLMTAIDTSLAAPAFVLGIAGIFLLRFFYSYMKVDTKSFQKKNWAGNIGIYFFTFLAIWVLTMNVPFSDHASPVVEDVIVWVDDGTELVGVEWKYLSSTGTYAWVFMDNSTAVGDFIHATAAYTLNLTARVTDNGKLVSVDLSVGGTSSYAGMIPEDEHRWGFAVSGDELDSVADLRFYIRAVDKSGNEVTYTPTSPLPIAP